jgi:16S rRNA (guanine1207-N2)-methyltransferase
MSHYFIEDNSLAPDEKTFSFFWGGNAFTFKSNSGLFSNGEPDPNSVLLLRNIAPVKNTKMLDLGCGWGLIGIAAAKGYGVSVTFSDINSNALRYAKINARENGVSGIFMRSDGLVEINDNFDLITLNPPIHAGKETVLRLFSESALHLRQNGQFVIVINEKHGAKSYEKALREIYKNVTTSKFKQTYIIKSEQ